jgi:hypothetical protein
MANKVSVRTEWTRSAPKDRTKRTAKVADKIDVKNIIKTVRNRQDHNYSDMGTRRVTKSRKSKNAHGQRERITQARVVASRR